VQFLPAELHEIRAAAKTNLHTWFAELLARQKVQTTKLQQQSVANNMRRMKREVKQNERFDELMKASLMAQFPTNIIKKNKKGMKSTRHHH
jgi:hypothetical protein